MSGNQAKKIAKEYADLLTERKVNFSRMYLFGSHVTGKNKKNSDIDVAVVAKDIRNYLPQKMRLWELAVEVDSRLEPILLSEKEMKGETLSILGDEVKKYGVRVV